MPDRPGRVADPISRTRMAVGRSLQSLVVRHPAAWPLLRGRMRRFFDERAATWDERTGAARAEHLVPLGAALLHVRPAPERVLEIGTGTGTGALLIAREFPTARIRGVDISEGMIRTARRKVGLDPEGRIDFKVADASALPYDEESFDLVAQVNVPPFFSEIARVVRPGGFVIVATSHGDAIPFYTPEDEIERRFARAGVVPVRTGTAGEGTFYVGRRENPA